MSWMQVVAKRRGPVGRGGGATVVDGGEEAVGTTQRGGDDDWQCVGTIFDWYATPCPREW